MTIRFLPYEASFVASVRAGGPDANGQPAERAISSGPGTPCRNCLQNIPAGAEVLVLAARPFPAPQPYAELGPIFFCASDCDAWHGSGLPPVLTSSPEYLVKGYSAEHRIVYGTGRITPASALAGEIEALLQRPGIAFVDVRSARNNCFLSRAIRVCGKS